MKVIFFLNVLVCLCFWRCSDDFTKISDNQFIGVWNIKGRSMFEGIQIKIVKHKNRFNGRISKLNSNKYIRLFANTNDTWISDISRISNKEFKLIEERIAKDLFSLYGQSSSEEFRVKFLDENTFVLFNENPKTPKITYQRVIK